MLWWHSKLREKKDDIRLVSIGEEACQHHTSYLIHISFSGRCIVPSARMFAPSCPLCSLVINFLLYMTLFFLVMTPPIILSTGLQARSPLPFDQYRMLSLLGLGVGMMLRSRRIISARLNAMPAMLSNCINDLQSTTVHIGLPDIELGKYPSWVWAATHIISDLQLVHEAPALEFQATLYFVTNWLCFPNQEKDMFKPVCYSRPNQSCPLYKRSQWRVSSVVHHDE